MNLVLLNKFITPGIILIRLTGLQPDVKATNTAAAIKEHLSEIKNNFMVITSEQ